jgi:DNA-directed RNA polymerase subunit RPC12/RpoP
VEITPPYGSQDALTKLPTKGDANKLIWINGTALDTGFGVASITIQSTNHTGNPWSLNLGNNTNWAFNNISAINNGGWEIWLNITDFASNYVLIQCIIFVDYAPPAGWQSTSTDINHPQNGELTHLFWINGTASDANGVGILNVSIVWTNSSAIWSVNLNNTSSWAFNNATSILDGVWQIRINFIDSLYNAQNLTYFIIVDTIAPSQPNVSAPIVSGSNVQLNWDPVPDPTGVIYRVYRNGNLIVNTSSTSYLDTNLPPGTYNYTIVPEDGAGNRGISSAPMTAIVEGTPFDWIPILIIILAAGIVGVSIIAIQRKRKRQPARRLPQPSVPSQPKPATAEPTKEAIPLIEALKLKTKKHTAKTPLIPGVAGEKIPSIVEKMEEEKVVKPKTIKFTFFCSTCKKWYATDEFAKTNCPECQNPLKLSYLCPKCKKRFIVKEPGMYDCPICKDKKLVP